MINIGSHFFIIFLLATRYKPVELKYVFLPLREEFEILFSETFNREANAKYLNHIMTCYGNKRWKDLIKLMMHVEKSAFAKSQSINEGLLDRCVDFFCGFRNKKQNKFNPLSISQVDCIVP